MIFLEHPPPRQPPPVARFPPVEPLDEPLDEPVDVPVDEPVFLPE